MAMNQETLVRALGHLGVDAQVLDHLRRIPFQQAVKDLTTLKAEVKTRYKKLAFELHPDRTGGDEAKTKLFSEVTEANRWFQELKLHPPPPRQVVQVVRVQHFPQRSPYSGTINWTNTTSTTTTTTSYNATKVAFIRFE